MTRPRRTKDFAYYLTFPWKKIEWTLEARRWRREYREELDVGRELARPGPLGVVLVLDHLKPRTNAGSLVRSADALGARAVHTVGMDYINPAPAMGAARSVPIVEHRTMAACLSSLRAEGYRIYALEPAKDVDERRYLDATVLAPASAIVVGHESHGVSFDRTDHPDVVWLSIRQFGRMPCLNAAVAGSIALYEFARQHGVRG